MSANAWSRPDDDGIRGGGSGAADDNDGESKEGKCKGSEKKVKFASFSWLKKNSKKLHQKRKEKRVSVNSGRRLGGGGAWWCFLCGKSSCQSPTSDPNSKGFPFDILRTLIESNDFYSNECNPHFVAREDNKEAE